jgi:trans-aconitate methyltransferase
MNFKQVAEIHLNVERCGVSTSIAPDDVMYNSGKDWYYATGSSALRVILSGLANSRLEAVSSILDLPCGHGRVSRYLRAAFPKACLHVSDLDPQGVAFCSRTFEASPIYSKPELTDVQFPQKYDVIWVGSLFTHVNEARTKRWLKYLCEQLNPDGILVASFHGYWSIEMHRTYYPMIEDEKFAEIMSGFDKDGWGYADYPSQANYGISVCKPSKLMKIAGTIPRCRVISYIERGWADNHDIVSIARTDRMQDWQSSGERW